VKRMWQKAIGTAALGLMLAGPVSGCASRPAPRPETTAPRANPDGTVDPQLSAAVTGIAAGVGGAGTTEAVVMGNVALVAIQLNSDRPGGAEGGPLSGKSHSVDYPGSSPSGGPPVVQGPGGSVGASPAREGGQINPGGATPGGSPNYTQAAPGNSMNQADQNATNTTPAPTTSAYGSAPLDVMNRIADQVRSRYPSIVEVRFATDPTDARQLADIARMVKGGAHGTDRTADLKALYGRSISAGTNEFSPQTPAQGTRPVR
jgi:hypothetical protein